MKDNQTPVIAGSYFALALAQTMVAVNIVGSKYLVHIYSMFFLLCTRFFIATVFLLLAHYLLKIRKKSTHEKQRIRDMSKSDWLYLCCQGLCGGAIVNYLLLFGLHYTSANSAGIITSALPAVLVVFSILFLREKLTIALALSIGFAILGLFVMNLSHFHHDNNDGLLGDILIIISLFPEAAYYILAKKHRTQLPIFIFSALINGLNFLITFIVMLTLGHFTYQSIGWHDAIILFIVGLTSGLFYIFWFLGCKHVSGLMSSLMTVVLPIATVIISWLWLGEHFLPSQIAGAALVLISILFCALRNRRLRLAALEPV